MNVNKIDDLDIAVVYMIWSPSGRLYVGQTIDFATRMRAYKGLRCKGQPLLYKSLKKYGFDAHRVEVIGYVKITGNPDYQKALDSIEDQFIRRSPDIAKSSLNLRGGGARGRFSDESKRKLSQSCMGRKISDEAKMKMSIAGKGRKKTAEHISKIKLANTNNPKKKLASKGENNNKAKLTEAQVLEIRSRHIPKKKGQNIIMSKEYGVSISTIERVASLSGNTKSWMHLSA